MNKENALIYVLMILLGVSMYTNDNCAVKEASDTLLQPFFYTPGGKAGDVK